MRTGVPESRTRKSPRAKAPPTKRNEKGDGDENVLEHSRSRPQSLRFFWPRGRFLLRCLTTIIRRKNIKILKPVKLKQNDVSCEVLVTAIDVKCNFT